MESCERNWNGITEVSGFASGWYFVNGLGVGIQREVSISEMMTLMIRPKGSIWEWQERRDQILVGMLTFKNTVVGLKETAI